MDTLEKVLNIWRAAYSTNKSDAKQMVEVSENQV